MISYGRDINFGVLLFHNLLAKYDTENHLTFIIVERHAIISGIIFILL